jgi:hypothetical protein
MLNPDGAERFVRHNAAGIDVNRDARVLATPEGRALKGVRDRFEPQFGFNLHDQNPRTRAGTGPALAAIALLAPPFDSAGSDNPVRTRSKHVASAIRAAMEPLVGGHIAKYDESFNPRAFGDLTTLWGTSTVLIESGGWRNDAQKQFLRSVNFVGLVKALDVIADSSWADFAIADYQSLPSNGRAVNDLLIRGASIVVAGRAPVRADIAADFEDAGGRATLARIYSCIRCRSQARRIRPARYWRAWSRLSPCARALHWEVMWCGSWMAAGCGASPNARTETRCQSARRWPQRDARSARPPVSG